MEDLSYGTYILLFRSLFLACSFSSDRCRQQELLIISSERSCRSRLLLLYLMMGALRSLVEDTVCRSVWQDERASLDPADVGSAEDVGHRIASGRV